MTPNTVKMVVENVSAEFLREKPISSTEPVEGNVLVFRGGEWTPCEEVPVVMTDRSNGNRYRMTLFNGVPEFELIS